MSKVAIVTDSNSGITQSEGKELDIFVVPMPFYINGKLYYEERTLSQEEFYQHLSEKAEISTSMPAMTDVTELWDKLLQVYEEIIYIPMSSGLSSSCQTAMMLAQDYDGKVQVVDNKRISVTQRQAAIDAKALADAGWNAEANQGLSDEDSGGLQHLYYTEHLVLSEKGWADHTGSGSTWYTASSEAGSADSRREARRLCEEPYLKGGEGDDA